MLKSLSLLLIILPIMLVAGSPEKSKELTSKAWQSFIDNDYKTAESSFLKSIDEDEKNSRAYLGLSILYSMLQKNDKSWDCFKKFTEVENNAAPYIYSQMLTPVFENTVKYREKIKFYEKTALLPDPQGILNVMCYERLQALYQIHGLLAKADSAADKMNAIKDWMLIGPFENVSASGYDKIYPPEKEFAPSKEYEGKNYIPVKWIVPAAIARKRWTDFMSYYGEYNSVYYANTFIYSPKAQTVQVRIGTSGSLKAILNDTEIINVPDEFNNDADTYIVETQLQSGWNKLLLKCGLSDLTQCNFLVRITDTSGKGPEGLTYSSSEQNYNKSAAPFKLVNNTVIGFFWDKIKENPEEPENYILLADSYLRNDMGIEAELVIRDGIKKFPGSSLFYFRMWESYLRGKKADDAETVLTKLYKNDPLIPNVLEPYINELTKKKNISEVENLMARFEKTDPDSSVLLLGYLTIAAAKKETDKLSSIIDKLYDINPNVEQYVYLKGVIEYQKTQDVNGLIKFLEDNLSNVYTEGLLNVLAQNYLQAGNKDRWEKTYERLIELLPDDPKLHFGKAEVYAKMQDYNKAAKELEKALEIAPYRSEYMEKLADIYKILDEKKEAEKYYKKAIAYDPKNYESRDKLRDIQGKKPIDQVFEEENINELISKSPSKTDYPGANALYLLNNTKKIIYGKGASESIKEELIAILDKRGIDQFKEYRLTEYSSVKTIIEESYTIKKDGTKIKAEANNGKLYFKSLEENDFIYIKTKTRDYFEGMLSNQYWDNHLFNGFYPRVKSSYSILFPDDINLNYKTHNFDLKPDKRSCDEGTIYEWKLENEPAIKEEPAMPQLYDIGKVLSISTIPDWNYLVEWFSDISRNKTRSSFEVKEKVKDLLDGKMNLLDEKKIEIIYNFITENIRYSYVPFRQSNFIPQSARDVLINKIGDCKDVATLFISMLNEAGIKADYVLVNTKNAGRNEGILPSVEFNHCIASVQLNNKRRYYDLTAENYDPTTLPWGDNDAFALHISKDSKEPVYLNQEENPEKIMRVHFASFKEDGIISDSLVSYKTSGQAAYTRDTYRYSGPEERLKDAQSNLNRDYPGAKINYIDFFNLDEITPEVRYTFVIDYPSVVTDAGAFKLFRLPWFDILSNDVTASSETRNYSLSLSGLPDTIYEKINIELPESYALLEPVFEKKFECSSLSYLLKYSVEGNHLTGERVFVRKEKEVKPEGYKDYREFYKKAMKEDTKQILMQKKG